MPRKVEVMRDGRAWVLNDVWTMDRAREVYGVDAARYVGGVLEQEDGGGGWIACDQHYTLDEAKAVTTHPWLAFRLRPYEDATANEAVRSGGRTVVKCDCGVSLQVLLGVTTICNCGVRWHGKSETEVAKLPPSIVKYGPNEKHKTAEEALAEVRAQGERARSTGFITSTTEVSGERLLEEWQDHVTDKAAELIRQAREKIELRRVTCEHERHRLVGEQWICSDCGHKWKATSWDQSEAARANRLSDECGSLRSELNEAYAKIGRQERELERIQRKMATMERKR